GREVRRWALKAFHNDAARAERFLEQITQRLGKRSARIAAAISRGDKVADFGTDLLARRLGVSRITVVNDLKAAASIHPTVIDGRLVAEIRVGPNTTIGELIEHLGAVDAIERYNGITGNLRRTW